MPMVADSHNFDEGQDPDPLQSEKSAPDSHQREKADPDPDQQLSDPKHCSEQYLFTHKKLRENCLAVFRIRIGSGFNQFSISVSGSRKAKMTNNN